MEALESLIAPKQITVTKFSSLKLICVKPFFTYIASHV